MQVQKNNENKAITIYDIAKEAGVSAATVSRVLTNSARVRPEKKKRVLELVEKYNFKPNALAKGLSDTRSKVLGIMTADIRNPYYAELFVACEQAARNAGYTVLLCNTLGETQREEDMLQMLKVQQAEAIIQMGGRVDDLVSNMEYVELVNQIMATTPVIITGKLDGTQCPMVRIDSMETMDLLMDHLLSLGHRKIAVIGGRKSVLSTYEKFLRYKQILKENGIPFDPDLISGDGSYNEISGYELMNQMFDKGVMPTAVIAVNDSTAAGVMRSIIEHGYQIPRDISLVSYDNTYMTEITIPKLTSIDYNYEEFGRELVETAIAAIEGREVGYLKTVTPKLVVRESSGPAVQTL